MRGLVRAGLVVKTRLAVYAAPLAARAAEPSPAPRDTLPASSLLWLAFDPADRAADPDTVALPSGRARLWQTGLLRTDRIQHASLALASGAAFGILTREPAAAAGSAMLLGVLKEVRDTRHTRFDWVDLAADAIGAALATLLTTDLVR
jgi:hypothetical protein